MLSIGTRLGISYGVLGALGVVTGAVSYQQTQTVRQKMEDVVTVREPVNSAVHALQNVLTESAFATLGYLSTSDTVFLGSLNGVPDRLAAIRDRFQGADPGGTGNPIPGTLEEEFARVRIAGEQQISLRDTQHRSMQALLQDLDGIDALLTQRIQASVSASDPVAYRRLQSVLEMKASVNAITRGLATFLATGDPSFEGRFQQAEIEFEKYFDVYRAVLLSSEEKRWAAELRRRSTSCLTQARSIFALDKQRRGQLEEFLSACRRLGALLDDRVLQHTEQSLSEGRADLLRAGDRAKASILVALVVSIAFGVGAGYLTTRNITRPLRELSSVMLAMARGGRTGKINPSRTKEVRALGEAFQLMTGKLREAERERLATLRQFASSVQRAQEDERARISRELHDDLCQRLSGMKFRVEVLEEEILPDSRRAQRRLRDFTMELDNTIAEVRRISSNLRPSTLDDFGLVTALRMLCRDFESLHGLETHYQPDTPSAKRVDPDIEIALYRIAQEALANVAKHADASQVRLELHDETTKLRLVISDDGKGFEPDAGGTARAAGHGFGLISMRERTELLGGSFEVRSTPGQGTTLTSILPLQGVTEYAQDQDPHRG